MNHTGKINKAINIALERVRSKSVQRLQEKYASGRSRSGELMRSISVDRKKHSIGSNKKYASYVERGTGLFSGLDKPRNVKGVFVRKRITPKKASVLSWKEGNKRVFAKSVKGQDPKWFIHEPMLEFKKELVRAIKEQF